MPAWTEPDSQSSALSDTPRQFLFSGFHGIPEPHPHGPRSFPSHVPHSFLQKTSAPLVFYFLFIENTLYFPASAPLAPAVLSLQNAHPTLYLREHFHQSLPDVAFRARGIRTEVYCEGMTFQTSLRLQRPVISMRNGYEETWSTWPHSPSLTRPRVTSSIDYFNDSITSNCVSPICSSPITNAETQHVSPFWQ